MVLGWWLLWKNWWDNSDISWVYYKDVWCQRLPFIILKVTFFNKYIFWSFNFNTSLALCFYEIILSEIAFNERRFRCFNYLSYRPYRLSKIWVEKWILKSKRCGWLCFKDCKIMGKILFKGAALYYNCGFLWSLKYPHIDWRYPCECGIYYCCFRIYAFYCSVLVWTHI